MSVRTGNIVDPPQVIACLTPRRSLGRSLTIVLVTTGLLAASAQTTRASVVVAKDVPLSSCYSSDNGSPVITDLSVNRRYLHVTHRARTLRVLVEAHDTGGPGARAGLAGGYVQIADIEEDAARRPLVKTRPGHWRATFHFPAHSPSEPWRMRVLVRDRVGNASRMISTQLSQRGFPSVVHVVATPPFVKASLERLTFPRRLVDTRRNAVTVPVVARLTPATASPPFTWWRTRDTATIRGTPRYVPCLIGPECSAVDSSCPAGRPTAPGDSRRTPTAPSRPPSAGSSVTRTSEITACVVSSEWSVGPQAGTRGHDVHSRTRERGCPRGDVYRLLDRESRRWQIGGHESRARAARRAVPDDHTVATGEGDRAAGVWRGTTTFTPCRSFPGTWGARLSIRDAAGNWRTYESADLANLGGQSSIEVLAGDHVVGGASAE